MIVKVIDYGYVDNDNYFVKYQVDDLDKACVDKLIDRLVDEVEYISGVLFINVYFKKEYFHYLYDNPRIDDIKASDEIEMKMFLSSLLEDI